MSATTKASSLPGVGIPTPAVGDLSAHAVGEPQRAHRARLHGSRGSPRSPTRAWLTSTRVSRIRGPSRRLRIATNAARNSTEKRDVVPLVPALGSRPRDLPAGVP
jgi:hypothetical protein